jgi:hypothetical protein
VGTYQSVQNRLNQKKKIHGFAAERTDAHLGTEFLNCKLPKPSRNGNVSASLATL